MGRLHERQKTMFAHCNTREAPWTVIKSDCKKRARLNAMRFVLQHLPCTSRSRSAIGEVDPLIVGCAARVRTEGDGQLAPSTVGKRGS